VTAQPTDGPAVSVGGPAGAARPPAHGRLVTSLVALYPRAWRNRYGVEVAALTGEMLAAGDTTRLRAGLDLGAGAAAQRCRAVVRSRRMRLAPAAAAIVATAAAGLAVARSHHSGPATRPYFENPSVATLLLVVVLAWFVMEFTGFLQTREERQWRAGATTSKAPTAFWITFVTCIVAAETWLYLAPPIVPAAAIRPPATAFAAGLVTFVAGIWLRAWAYHALGEYHTWGIVVSPEQPVISTGPYALVRHPGYAGGLLVAAGIGLMSANWAGLAAMVLLPAGLVVWRIRMEERALLATLHDRYRGYAARHKRLIPLVW
jgi:protein-S-isoprenylcysteine O-methyltransferase Ste14